VEKRTVILTDAANARIRNFFCAAIE